MVWFKRILGGGTVNGRGTETSTDDFETHIRSFFEDHKPIRVHRPTGGPMPEAVPDFRTLEIGKGPRTNCVTYVSCGASTAHDTNPLEFLMMSSPRQPSYARVVEMIAFYSIAHRLGLGHHFSIGTSLAPGSVCEAIYLALPYLFGPKLEWCSTRSGDVRTLWAVPITAAEQELLRQEGPEALEQLFEAEAFDYWSPLRESVV